jgi:hypothetical protein
MTRPAASSAPRVCTLRAKISNVRQSLIVTMGEDIGNVSLD